MNNRQSKQPLTLSSVSKCSYLVLLIMILLCAGCVGSRQPVSFYLLQPLAVKGEKNKPIVTPALGVGRIEIAEYLQRPQLLQTTNDFELQRSEKYRWAEPLGESVQRLMFENLNRLMANKQLQSFPFRAESRPQWVLLGRVLALDVDSSYQAELRVDWQWLDTHSGRRVVGEQSRFRVAASAGPAAQAKAYSQLLLQWSEAVTAQIVELN